MTVQAGRIGPNAITRVAEAMLARLGQGVTFGTFERAGLSPYLAHPPSQMVDEGEVLRLHCAMRDSIGEAQAREVAFEAGLRTGDYLLANRIPRPVQSVLKWLPASLAARVLLAAVRRHAWTFAGSGEFTARAGHPVVLKIRCNPLCVGVKSDTPACAFYAATFERLFRSLVHPRATVHEVACESMGAPACVFEVTWHGQHPGAG